MINADGMLKDGGASRVRARVWASLGCALLALAACGAPDRTALAPPTAAPMPTEAAHTSSPSSLTPLPTFISETPFPTFTPVTPFYPTPTEGTPLPTSETPLPRPTAPPTRVVTPVALPPAPTLPLAQALAQLGDNALLYNWNGFLMVTDGQHDVWLTADKAICDHQRTDSQGAVWSTDGRFLAITCEHIGVESVALLDMRTGVIGLVDAGAGDILQVVSWPGTWSPVAPTFLLYHLRADSSGRLSIVDAPTGKVETLFDHKSNQLSTAWSPDGAQIAIYTGTTFHGGRGTYELFLLNADGSNLRRFEAPIASDQCHGIEWSQDLKFIFIGGCLRIVVDTGVATSVDRLNGDRMPSDVRPSPNGAYYLSSEQLNDGYGHWWLRRADSTIVRDLTDQPDSGISDIAWMPDSKHVIIVGQNEKLESVVRVVDLTGQTKTLLTSPYSFSSTSILEIAPDSSMIAVGFENEIALLDLQGRELANVQGWLLGWRPRG
jgi:WD40 repeat protein